MDEPFDVPFAVKIFDAGKNPFSWRRQRSAVDLGSVLPPDH
jgi:hypothetical protein